MSTPRALFLCAALCAGMHFSTGQTLSSPPSESPPAPRLKAAARTFAIVPQVGMPSGHTRFGIKVQRVWGDLKSTIVLFEDGDKRMVFLTSTLSLEGGTLYDASRAVIAEALRIAPENVVLNSSHNHSVPSLSLGRRDRPEQLDRAIPDPARARRARTPRKEDPVSRALGEEYLAKLREAAASLPEKLEPVTVKWGISHEDRITYNRRGHKPGGQTYFIREEDRALLPPHYKGMIDTEAIVVLFDGKNGPVACLAWYTGHPVTVYDPEDPTSFGEWPQVACEKLSAHLGGIPVAFVQGCAGDINSKYMFSGTREQATELGGFLGDAFIAATKILKTSKRDGFQLRRQMVDIPLGSLPPLAGLERDLVTIDDFIKRAQSGDQNTLYCVGMNFPKHLTPEYRATLIEAVRPWYVWAIEQHQAGKADQVDKSFPLEIVVARIGDVGFAGMPDEAFVRTGFKIKYGANLPCVLASGYTGVSNGYIPDATACEDLEYMSGNYRYRRIPRAPYRAPGGDAMADAAIITLNEFAKTEPR